AEEVVQDSLVAALENWPAQGIPDNPGAWLMTAARRRAIDLLRRDQRYAEKIALLQRSTIPAEPAEADDRLRLIFTCCHPPLAEGGMWLTSVVARLLPDQPEVLGLIVLMRLHLARSRARFDSNGDIVLLPDQDRALWDSTAIAQAVEVLDRAAAMSSPGPYQLQAAIAAVHSAAPSWRETDWQQIVALYDTLLRIADTPIVRLNRAVALSHVS